MRRTELRAVILMIPDHFPSLTELSAVIDHILVFYGKYLFHNASQFRLTSQKRVFSAK
jgi:hypothetical protein